MDDSNNLFDFNFYNQSPNLNLFRENSGETNLFLKNNPFYLQEISPRVEWDDKSENENLYVNGSTKKGINLIYSYL